MTRKLFWSVDSTDYLITWTIIFRADLTSESASKAQNKYDLGRQLPVIIRRFIMSYFTQYYDFITYDYDDI